MDLNGSGDVVVAVGGGGSSGGGGGGGGLPSHVGVGGFRVRVGDELACAMVFEEDPTHHVAFFLT